jgi:hypothetical protein
VIPVSRATSILGLIVGGSDQPDTAVAVLG